MKKTRRRTKPYIGVCRGIENVVLLHAVSVSVGCLLPCSDMSWEVSGEVPYNIKRVPFHSSLNVSAWRSGTARSLFSLLVCYAWKQGGEKLSFFLGNPVCEKFLYKVSQDALPIEEGVGSRQVIPQWNFHGDLSRICLEEWDRYCIDKVPISTQYFHNEIRKAKKELSLRTLVWSTRWVSLEFTFQIVNRRSYSLPLNACGQLCNRGSQHWLTLMVKKEKEPTR